MTDAGSLLTGLFTNLAYGLPITVAFALAIAWLAFGRGRWPPRFAPTPPDRRGIRGPTAAVYEGLQDGHLAPAIEYAHYRTARALERQYGVSVYPQSPGWWVRRELPPTAAELLHATDVLARAYNLARMGEDETPADLFRRWRAPVWRARSVDLFRRALTDVEPILRTIEATA